MQAFCDRQYLFRPVVLYRESTYSPGCRLPSVKDERRFDKDRYGEVWEVEVEQGHMSSSLKSLQSKAETSLHSKSLPANSTFFTTTCTFPSPLST